MKTKFFVLLMAIFMTLGSTPTFGQFRKTGSTSKSNGKENVRRESGTRNESSRTKSTSRNQAKEPSKTNPPKEIPRGYEDKVKYDKGNWCYLRDGKWYSYDHYIEPDVYYSRPLSEFGKALVVGTLVGCIISAIAN